MTKDDRAAIEILYKAYEGLLHQMRLMPAPYLRELEMLVHAIRHLAHPDRDVYPKTRKGTKGAPIVRRQPTVDDVR